MELDEDASCSSGGYLLDESEYDFVTLDEFEGDDGDFNTFRFPFVRRDLLTTDVLMLIADILRCS